MTTDKGENTSNTVTVYSPATVANMTCGFDVLGFALDGPFDKMVITKTERKGVEIINKDDYNLPTKPEDNIIGVALLSMLKQVDEEIGFKVESTKIIKPGSGIGSSAASAAGAVVGANNLLNNRFSQDELMEFALDGEEIASKSRHADNVAPCLYGGISLIRSVEPIDVVRIPAPILHVTIVHPQIEVKTSESRKLLGDTVPLKDAVTQWGNVGSLIAGLYTSNYDLIGRSLVDVVVEPFRKKLIPMFDEIKAASMIAGSLGGGISGSGPSVFMLSKDAVTAKKIESAIKEVYKNVDFEFNTHTTTISNQGVKLEY
jgi:homoserine kinase